LAALAVLAALAAGCGESKTEDFKKEFRPVNDRIIALGRQVGRALEQAQRESNSQIERQFRSLALRTGRLRQEVDDLEPPGELESAHRDLLEAMGKARKGLDGISDAAGAGKPRAATRASLDLLDASDDLRAARQKLARATGAKLR
jgi:hypothetical protein